MNLRASAAALVGVWSFPSGESFILLFGGAWHVLSELWQLAPLNRKLRVLPVSELRLNVGDGTLLFKCKHKMCKPYLLQRAEVQ